MEVRTKAALDSSELTDKALELNEAIGLNTNEGEEGVLLSVSQGSADVHLHLCPSDIAVLREALDLCDKRVTDDQAAKRADDQWEADCA